MRRRVVIAGAVVVVAALVVVGIIASREDVGHQPVLPAEGFARPLPWAMADGRRGEIDLRTPTASVDGVAVSAPQPLGAEVSWRLEEQASRQTLVGTGTLRGAEAQFRWQFAEGNPHTVFSAAAELPTAQLQEPLISTISLDDGELTYVDPALQRVPFAGTPVTIGSLTAGPIVWRSGEKVLSLWQWNADRVTIAATEAGGYVVQFHWWEPAQHPLPDDCAAQLANAMWRIEPQLTISFAEAPDLALGRIPGGVASAVVPIFVDPMGSSEPHVRDGAAPTAEDFVARARTMTLGHSSPKDARHGNGGLAGLGVGGTVLVPAEYAEVDAVAELAEALAATTIELTRDAVHRPADCAAFRVALSEAEPILDAGAPFDGRFPNLLGPEQRDRVPGIGAGPLIWQPTVLTGRRKDVVTQTLSSSYLTRLAEARGLAVLEIPLVATRNPLVPAAAEALLDPERDGHWTIQEDVARALAEVELLAEGERFDFVGLRALTRFTVASRGVVIDEVGDGLWRVHNGGDSDLQGFTMVARGDLDVRVDGATPARTSRELGNGTTQTWFWWDVAPGATYELSLGEQKSTNRAVSWGAPPAE